MSGACIVAQDSDGCEVSDLGDATRMVHRQPVSAQDKYVSDGTLIEFLA